VMGGYDGERVRSSVLIFDPALNAWTQGPAMLGRRSNAAAAACAGHIYAFGGTANDQNFRKLRTTEQFDPETGAWTETDAMPMAGNEFAAGDIGGPGLIMAVGSGIFGEARDQVLRLHCQEA
jgi:hypothetical protein